MITMLTSLVFLLTVNNPLHCELIDPAFCPHVLEAIQSFEGRTLTAQELATKRKLEEWAQQAGCNRASKRVRDASLSDGHLRHTSNGGWRSSTL